MVRFPFLEKTPMTSLIRRNYVAKKGGKKTKKPAKYVDDFLDELSDDEDDEREESVRKVPGEIPDTPASRFIENCDKTSGSGKGKKREKVKASKVDYIDVVALVPIEQYWCEMENIIEKQRHFFIHNVTVRSMNALDDLEVELEGDKFPLKEVASISKRDPKRLTIDTSTFPQATANIVNMLRSSTLTLNPQQDGTRIYVTIPKVTKEHRENLAKAAKAKFNETKVEMQSLQNKYVKKLGDLELSNTISVPKEHFNDTKSILMAMEHHFLQLAESDCHKKQKDIMGGK